MPKEFDTETIHIINIFENLTGTEVKDCIIEGDTVYIGVEKGKVGYAIGKNGILIKRAEKAIRRNIKVFEFSDDLEEFVKNLIPMAKEVIIKEDTVEVKVDKKDRPIVIGRDEKNLKIIKKLLERNHNIKNLIIR